MTIFLQYMVNGIMSGGVYSLIALGIVLIYKASKVFNFAIGEMVMFGALFMWTFLDVLGLHFLISLFLSVLVCALIGFIMERLSIQPLIGQPILSVILVTLGLSHILRSLSVLVWGGTNERLSVSLPGEPIFIGGVVIPNDLLWCFAASVIIFIFFTLFYKYTNLGLAMRAVAEDHTVAQARGVNVKKIFGVVWAVAGIVTSIGGILLAYRLGISQMLGIIGLKAFPAVLFGGIESIAGAFIGGIVVGLLESLAGGYIAGWLMETSPYIVLLLVLIFRPEGLFGLKKIERI